MTDKAEDMDVHQHGVDGIEVTRDAFLDGKVVLYQPKHGHRAGVDAVLLAASVDAAKNAAPRIMDVGAGPGTVGLLIATRLLDAKVTCVEIEEGLAHIGVRNRDENALKERVEIINADIFEHMEALERMGLRPGQFDHVVSNPPYYSDDSGRVSNNLLKRRANSMQPHGLDRWIKFMTAMAHADGRLSIIYPADRLDDLLRLLTGRFGNLQIFPIYPHAGDAANRVIIRGHKGSRAPLKLHSGLVLHEADGAFTNEASRSLRLGAALDMGAC